LHDNLIVHRDIAARNVLLTSGGGRKRMAKICDLGISRLLVAPSAEQMTVTPEVDASGTVIRREWLAPEQIVSGVYSFATDSFAFAVLLFEIFKSEAPWAEFARMPPAAVGMRVLRGERLTPPSNAPPAVQQLMLQCWDANPQARPTVSAVRKVLADEMSLLIKKK
jgi:serine/threonine protein kinase